jgi:hypothetical protein
MDALSVSSSSACLVDYDGLSSGSESVMCFSQRASYFHGILPYSTLEAG